MYTNKNEGRERLISYLESVEYAITQRPFASEDTALEENDLVTKMRNFVINLRKEKGMGSDEKSYEQIAQEQFHEYNRHNFDRMQALKTEKDCPAHIVAIADAAIKKITESDELAQEVFKHFKAVPSSDFAQTLVGTSVKYTADWGWPNKGDILTIESVEGDTVQFKGGLRQKISGFYEMLASEDYVKF